LFKQLPEWLDDRTGFRDRRRRLQEVPIPGGPRWIQVFGSALTAVVLVQALTGVLLMTSYSPSTSAAWGSVFYINRVMWMGWFIRGLHHFTAEAIMFLLGAHLVQVVWTGAYRRPREFTWWLGIALFVLFVGLGHTGYQLPWDQKGYWSTKVSSNILSGAPVLGPYLQKLVEGGSDYGNQTLTRLYALHVAVLPALVAFCLVAHVVLFRRHGFAARAASSSSPGRVSDPAAESQSAESALTTDHSRRTTDHSPVSTDHKPTRWTEQRFRSTAFTAALFAVLVGLVLWNGGANLDAPADPSSSDYPARPEIYFLPLYQMLKFFPGKREVIGTIVIPTAILTVLFFLPFLDRLFPRKLAHFLACGFMFVLVGGGGYLLADSLIADVRSADFRTARANADVERDRAVFLASLPDVGVPPDGSHYVLVRDPLTHGRKVLERRCLSCHYLDGKGTGEQTAADLAQFGTRAWLHGLLENPKGSTYFGKVSALKGMVEWKKNSKLKPNQLEHVEDFVASFAGVAPDVTTEEWLDSPGVADHPGRALFEKECGTCHKIEGFTEGGIRDAPNLFAWGSPQWIARMTRKPGAPDRYGFLDQKDQMPAFAEDQVSANDMDMIIRYLKSDYPK
jgi:ubiquinol-cytochrome c reductase cytochrome b subunit